MIVVWSVITLGGLIVAFLSFLTIKLLADGEEEAVLTILGLGVAILIIFVTTWFKTYNENTIEVEYEYHKFKDRIIVVSHGVLKEYVEMGSQKCFEDNAVCYMKYDYNIFDKVVEKHIVNSCEMEEQKLEEEVLEELQEDG